jgi:hypothetical protein
MRHLLQKIGKLLHDASGVTVVEFALTLPLLMLMGLGGLEIANIAVTHMRINQIAVSLADNASRMKQQTVSGAPQFREFDANEALKAAELQGADLDLPERGRVILSSLEVNGDGGQWIHWQRCSGAKTAYISAYGAQGTGATGTAFTGMGPVGHQVTAEPGAAIMVAEVAYDYRPLIIDKLFDTMTIRKYSAMYVRDDRDLTGIFNPSPTAPVASC